MKEVVLHVYDVTNSGSEKTNNTILQINRIFKDRIGLGGIFHSAIQVSSSSSVPRFSFSSYKLLSFLFFSPCVAGFLEMKNGLLGFANKVLEFSVVRQVEILCIPTVSV
ncbi:hypothetical protein BHE74_00056635 [Ensete ventricosum]|uniref:PPPDE domain-containing protein n=1 Tax=Ensete ventricosum TaxID=4639 RepID=A0A426YSZ5_ENSVE|nr:hypothetical protein B296_00048859 [Ensete ventricosum]RWW38157.1 hypothetical protein BHE74_00056635 [Ensete ventricosum]